MRPQPGAQQRPEAFQRVDVHLAQAVAVLITSVFTASMTDRLVAVTPLLQPSIDVVLVGVDEGACSDRGLDDRLDGLLLDIGQHLQHDLATALDQPQDWRLLFRQRAATGCALEPSPPPQAPFLATAAGWPLCPATTWTSSTSTVPSRTTAGAFATSPVRRCSVMTCTSLTLRPSSWAICRLERLRPIRYRHSTQSRSGRWCPARAVPVRSSKRLPQAEQR